MVSGGIDPMQLASQGAQVLVAEMVKSSWAGLREKLPAIFRRGGGTSRHLEMIDADQQQLIQVPEADQEAVRARLLSRWQLQLAAFLDQYPETAEDLIALIEYSAGGAGDRSGGHSLAAFGNTASQIVQAAGDVRTGGGDISFIPPTP
jgi:hypothetical protein